MGGILIFLLGYRFYGNLLIKTFRVDFCEVTPAHKKKDGIDYVPTQAPVLFGHHFASIAGAGPIVGPVLGAAFGWGPMFLWIVLGSIFIGAVHDFAARCVSIRHQGLSVGWVIEEHIGFFGRQIFLTFSVSALFLVVAIFSVIIAQTFTATPSVSTASFLLIILAILFGWTVNLKKCPCL